MSESDNQERSLADALVSAHRRLAAQGLAAAPASLSLRLPAGRGMLVLEAANPVPARMALDPAPATAPASAAPAVPVPPVAVLHAAIYRMRADVGAIAVGGGRFGRALSGLGGALPLVFDEQARHLGWMRGPAPAGDATADGFFAGLDAALERGGNCVLIGGTPVCLGMTCQRMVFNAELFEKCATAYVLARATGGPVTRLPWWVNRIATGRLRKDQQKAAQRFAHGLLPEDVRGY